MTVHGFCFDRAVDAWGPCMGGSAGVYLGYPSRSLSRFWWGARCLDCRGPALQSAAGPMKGAVYAWEQLYTDEEGATRLTRVAGNKWKKERKEQGQDGGWQVNNGWVTKRGRQRRHTKLREKHTKRTESVKEWLLSTLRTLVISMRRMFQIAVQIQCRVPVGHVECAG